ncbi:GNAT family N-acetyltransferase [Loigolactobacillus binensis]|uniref:GNAT family N-acetyltransferase n=1 Tax=Loigolactobacillus binensis TaxID=2559922 RepID=A0ABW3EA33_9LACO|nr:GNAT family N-acetyltransferase [Loigolactobacillus binensis]
MQINKISTIKRDLRPDISAIFVEGFYEWLKFFSKDKTKLTRTFTHIFNPKTFYAATEDNVVLGFAACTDGSVPSIKLQSHEFRRHLGLLRGTVAYQILKREFEDKPYPFTITPGMGTIEFVATAGRSRGRGVATKIIQYIHANTDYTTYVLEVADSNLKALRLYEKLGYQVFKKIPEPHAKRSGFNFYLYMQYTKR